MAESIFFGYDHKKDRDFKNMDQGEENFLALYLD